MNNFSLARLFQLLVLAPALWAAVGRVDRRLHAEDILFFGNSFTSVNDVPKMVEAIATSKGKTASTMAVTKGGQGWPYHLIKPATDPALTSKAWGWVVLQDQSLNATRARKEQGDDFLKTGQQFYRRIAEKSPTANILLYETWAYAPQHDVFSSKDGKAATFSNPAEMYGEIHKNYASLQTSLQAKDPTRRIVVALVGTAFANCTRQHPEINIYASDSKHQNMAGSYLSALVIYATIFHDSPVGAAPGKKVDPKEAAILQQVAEETVRAAQPSK